MLMPSPKDLYKQGVEGDSCLGCVYCLQGGAACVVKGKVGRVKAGIKGLKFPLSCDERKQVPGNLPTPDNSELWELFKEKIVTCPGMPIETVPIAFSLDNHVGIEVACTYGDWLKEQGLKVSREGKLSGPKRFIKGFEHGKTQQT